MNPGLLVKLRPTGPWRIGPDSGARNQVDAIYHSDTLYAAVTSALVRLGMMEPWLDATTRSSSPAVCFSSCFPFVDEVRFIIPPRTIWPPTSPALLSARVRWKSARFVPLEVVEALLGGQSLDEHRWAVDGTSGCLMPAGSPGPFRTGLRFNAAVDRLTGAAERHSTACLEFRPGAGLWAVISFADENARAHWAAPLKTAFSLLADSGFGGERSRGWGRADTPEFIEGSLPEMVLGGQPAEGQAEPPPPPEALSVEEPTQAEGVSESNTPAPAPFADPAVPAPVRAHWLLSLFTPAATDEVDWQRGNYTVLERGGRVESPARSGELKKQLHMVAEGSVLYTSAVLRGSAPDVAPDGFVHPVFRSGFAVSIPLPEMS
ncbi:MAG: hypothetical protein C5B51_08520 [Terriglobia bacterium]|nr:MAG: hypothetical protein C5B51_08520 [Terriglobia bacterium]